MSEHVFPGWGQDTSGPLVPQNELIKLRSQGLQPYTHHFPYKTTRAHLTEALLSIVGPYDFEGMPTVPITEQPFSHQAAQRIIAATALDMQSLHQRGKYDTAPPIGYTFAMHTNMLDNAHLIGLIDLGIAPRSAALDGLSLALTAYAHTFANN